VTHFEEAQFEATVGAIPRCREFVARACARAGADEAACLALKLAVDEVFSNVVEHGAAAAAGGHVAVSVEGTTGELLVTVVDDGKPFDPNTVPAVDAAADWQERRIGGLGWHLVRQAVDEVRYRREGDRNHLVLIKRLNAEPKEEGHDERQG
jgi:anti-sigma regulatory factor (Ser/Thr protein kinase)